MTIPSKFQLYMYMPDKMQAELRRQITEFGAAYILFELKSRKMHLIPPQNYNKSESDKMLHIFGLKNLPTGNYYVQDEVKT